ncbi:hypothetical protein ZIOFF_014529 [Zingiber officinale]|uniref:Retrovirus-related Pol polyprotein from transposon TNT 1-94 n=1 Tax=Zingiber officinale TaxID=94328 RepID=A0A8J5LPJ8_ZINOF|nr:hypothetical protein ZIOFF_014529 [Zingiber officinale]
MLEGTILEDHLTVFKEIVSDLESMEVKYDEEDLDLILLCSLPTSYAIFRDTILYTRDSLTLDKVYDVLLSKEKMDKLVGGLEAKSESLVARGRPHERSSGGNSGLAEVRE